MEAENPLEQSNEDGNNKLRSQAEAVAQWQKCDNASITRFGPLFGSVKINKIKT